MKKNIFWTGGFDSTFRLLQLIDDDNVNQIEIFYISLFIDNTSDGSNDPIDVYLYPGRRSIEYELESMSIILSLIDTKKISKFTIIGKSEYLLFCNLIFNYSFMNYVSKETIEYSDETRINLLQLYDNELVLRPTCQWGAITEVLNFFDIEAEICIEKGGGFWTRLNHIIVDGKLNFDAYPGLKLFSRYQLPILEISKEEMLKISQEKKWTQMINLTWSCWYPENGEPCMKCFACKERLV